MNLEKELQKTLTKGKVIFGKDQVVKSIKSGAAKLVIISKNCHFVDSLANISNESGIRLHRFSGDSKRLGALCKKKFTISALAVLDAGGSKILKAGEVFEEPPEEPEAMDLEEPEAIE